VNRSVIIMNTETVEHFFMTNVYAVVIEVRDLPTTFDCVRQLNVGCVSVLYWIQTDT
jgi:hypothetical protein